MRKEMKRKNVLILLTDQQQAMAMSCTGNEDLNTPNMDRLARRGVRFTRAYCTYPLCTPSRASIISGRMPHEVGVLQNNAPIAENFRQEELGHVYARAGYRCAYAGKWHLPELDMTDEHGFESIAPFNDNAIAPACERFFRDSGDSPFLLFLSFDNPHNICELGRNATACWGSVPEVSPEEWPNLPPNFKAAPREPAERMWQEERM